MSGVTARRATWIVSALGALVAVALALVDTGLALVALGVGLLGLTAAAFLSFRLVVQHLLALEQQRPGQHQQPKRPNQPVLRRLDELDRSVNQQFAAMVRQVDAQPYVHAELVRKYGHLIHSDAPMPTLGANWAATAPTILFIVDEILGNHEVERILECGSGASTVWSAAAFKHRGRGHVWSLDHDAEFAEVTRQNLRAHGLEEWATVIDAPLTETDVPGRHSQPWYDVSALPAEIRDLDLLFVDGPPRLTSKQARYPAYPVLADRLRRPGALVVLDDVNRRDERDIAKLWADDAGLRRYKTVGRSSVFETVPEG